MILEKSNNKYTLVSDYNERFIIKQAGFVWNSASKKWETDSPVIAASFAEYAEDEIKMYLLNVRKQANETYANTATEKPIEQFYEPDGYSLYPFQKEGIRWLSRRQSGSLLADSMGLGKTLQAIGVINQLDDILRALIICPASLRINWLRELDRWLKVPRKISIVNTRTGWPEMADIIIINYDILHRFISELRQDTWDLLILDEAHYCRNPKTKRTQHVFGKKWRYSRKREWELTPIPAKRKIYITGTPIVNRPVDLWPLVHSLDPVNFSSYDRFTHRYCGARRGRWGWDVSGATNLEELQKLLKSTIMLRRRKDEVLTELPPKVIQVIELPEDGKGKIIEAERKAFMKYESSLSELVVSSELAKTFDTEDEYQEAVSRLKSGINLAFSQLSTERQRVALAKVPIVLEYLEGIDEKVVVFCHHRSVIELLLKHLSKQAVSIYGETPLKERQSAIDKFQSDPSIKYFLGSIQSAGVGITLTAARIAIFVEQDWTPSNMEQASDRLHRIGQSDTVLIQHLVFNNSVDAKIAHTLVAKQEVISQSLDSGDVSIIALPFKDTPSTVTISYREVEDNALLITQEQKELLRSTLEFIKAKAYKELNDFDKIILDTLLAARYLSNKEAAFSKKFIEQNSMFLTYQQKAAILR